MIRTSVVIATRDRPVELARTLGRLRDADPRMPVIVVDNASDQDLRAWVPAQFHDVEVVRLDTNRGAAGRTVGVRRARTPFVAFCDDDSCWAPGAFALAEQLFDRYPSLAVIAARTLVGDEGLPDSITTDLARSPLRDLDGLPGPRVLGFLACSAIVRRDAYLGVGGFHPVLHFAGEERLLSLDLATRGWNICYVHELVARHHPSRIRPPSEWRRRREMRNDALTEWMRRPVTTALLHSGRLVRRAFNDSSARGAVADLVRALPTALMHRRPIPAPLEREVRQLETFRLDCSSEAVP